MSTNFPTSLDALTNPSANDTMNSPSHSGQHANANDAIEALEAKVGIDDSSDKGSLDFKVRRSPFDFPISGMLRAESRQKQLAAGDLTFNVFSSPVGTDGVVRSIQIIFYMGTGYPVTTGLSHLSLQIKYDGEASPSQTIPLQAITAYEQGASILTFDPFETPFFDITQPTTPTALATPTAGTTHVNEMGFILKYPIPYTNGISLDIVSDSDSYLAWFWVTTVYNDDLPACWNRNLRFKATRSNEAVSAYSSPAGSIIDFTANVVTFSGTNFNNSYIGKALSVLEYPSGVSRTDEVIVAVPDATHLTLEATPKHPPLLTADLGHTVSGQIYDNAISIVNKHEWLNLAAGKAGWIACVIGSHSVTDTSPKNHVYETSVRLYIDQETSYATFEYSGMEDFFGGSFYWQLKKRSAIGGVTAFANGKFCGYRSFHNDPIRFTNGIIGTIFNTFYMPTTYNWTTIYYEEV